MPSPRTLSSSWLDAAMARIEADFQRSADTPLIALPLPEFAVAQIEFYGGRCHWVDSAAQVYDEARRLATETGGHYMDQFTYAERATDWRGNNNIAESMFSQMAHERHPVPRWIVVGAGTGGTSATIGRYVRYQRHNSQPCVEASFIRTVIDRMTEVPDADSLAAMQALSQLLGRKVGPSTGTNFVGMLKLAHEMLARGEQGSILSLLCDSGERYLPTYYDAQWVQNKVGDCAQAHQQIEQLMHPALAS